MTYPSEVLADTPYGYWKLDEPFNGSNPFDPAADSSGNSRPLSLVAVAVASPYGATGLLSKEPTRTAATVAGSDRWVRTAESFANATSGGGVTLEGWVKVTPGQTAAMNVIAIPGMRLYINNPAAGSNAGALLADVWTAGGPIPTVIGTNVADGAAHHVAATANGTAQTAKVYVDGNLAGSISLSSGLYTGGTGDTGGGVVVGRNPGVINGVIGTIDDLAVYFTEISGARLAAHAAAGSTVTAAGTAALAQASVLTAAGVRGKAGTAALTQAAVLSASAVGAVTASGTAALTQASVLTASATVFVPANVPLGPWVADLSRSAGFALDVQIGLTVAEAEDPAEALAIPRDTESEVYADPVLVDGRPT